MAKVSMEEGRRIAERAAWSAKGERNEWWYTWGQRIVPPVAGVAILAGLGYAGVTWIIDQLSSISTPRTGGVPFGAWLGLLALVVLTAVGIKAMAAARRFGTVVLVVAALIAGWGGAAAYAIGAML